MERVTDGPESLAQSADRGQVNDYDSFAEAYSAETENNFVNAYYERPAMLVLAGDVAGRRILDAGCGSGSLSAALRDRGAIVTGIDASARMLALARRRLGDDLALHVVDLSDRLPFADGAFDDVAAFAGAALLGGLGADTGRVAASAQARRPADRVCGPPFRGLHDPGSSARLLCDHRLHLRLDVQREVRPDEVLAQAVARDDRCLHHRRFPPCHHQRAAARPGRP